jgi:hypothetical protein
LRSQALRPLLALLLVLGLAAPAAAAEVLQVRGPTLLELGDRNRSYAVELACLAIEPGRDAAARAWLREAFPRRSRVNLRPLGSRDGHLLARVSLLNDGLDATDGLIAAGLAHATACS